jgi:diguanylate cyclase
MKWQKPGTYNFKQKVEYLFSFLAILCITPFALYRFLQGEILSAIADLCIVAASVLSAVRFQWKDNQQDRDAYIIALVYSCGALCLLYAHNVYYIIWIYPTLFANTFLLGAKKGLVLNVVLVLLSIPSAFETLPKITSLSTVLALIFGLGMSFGYALFNERQKQVLQNLAIQDPLTQIGNRRWLMEELFYAWHDFQRTEACYSLLLIDIDYFKKINDTHGHLYGDFILVTVSKALKKCIRNTDKIFRYGGEEFIVLAKATKLSDAMLLAEKIRKSVEEHVFDEMVSLTVSIGCAELRSGKSIEEWIKSADAAAYNAKNIGRNRVIAASDD